MISKLMQGEIKNMDTRRKAEVLGMMVYELQTEERDGNVLAKAAVQLLTFSCITVTLPLFKPRQPRGLPAEVQTAINKLKRYKAEKDEQEWTHSSLAGGRDPITSTGKMKVCNVAHPIAEWCHSRKESMQGWD